MAWRFLTGMMALAMLFVLMVGGTQPGAAGMFTAPWDKLAHMGYFLVFTLLLLQALPGRWWLCLGIAMAIGVSDELHQMLLPGREPSLFDWLADAGGAGAALFLQHWFFSGKNAAAG